MFLKSLLKIHVIKMDEIVRDPELLATCRTLSHGGSSGMNMALNYYEQLIQSRSVDAMGCFANYQQSCIGWALVTRETDNFHYRPATGTVCFQVYVHHTYRRNGVGTALLKKAKSLVPTENLMVYGTSGHYFFNAHLKEGLCRSVYGG